MEPSGWGAHLQQFLRKNRFPFLLSAATLGLFIVFQNCGQGGVYRKFVNEQGRQLSTFTENRLHVADRLYVADHYGGNIYLCSTKSDGTVDACSTSNANMVGWRPTGIVLAMVGGKPYAYVSNVGAMTCPINPETGELIRCTPTAGNSHISVPARGFFAHRMTILNVGNAPMAYVSDPWNKNVYLCGLDSTNGSPVSCSVNNGNITGWIPYDITFANVNGVYYAYVADGNRGNAYQCTLNNDGTFNACSIVKPGNLGDRTWYPNRIDFASLNGVTRAIVAGDRLYECTLDANGGFKFCSDAAGALPPLSRINVSIRMVDGIAYAYVSNIRGDATSGGDLFRCLVNWQSGSLASCLSSSGNVSFWTPSGVF